MPRGIRVSVVQLLAGVLLVVATTALPWATYTNRSSDHPTWFRGGSVATALVTLGVASILLSTLSFARSTRSIRPVQLAVGCVAVVVSVALALTKIHAANHFGSLQDGGAKTSYASGSGLGIAASVVIAVTSAVALTLADAAISVGTEPGFGTSSGF